MDVRIRTTRSAATLSRLTETGPICDISQSIAGWRLSTDPLPSFGFLRRQRPFSKSNRHSFPPGRLPLAFADGREHMPLYRQCQLWA